MAKARTSKAQLPEYGELISIMQNETASILSDYIRQYVGVASKPEPGSGVFRNFDRVLTTAIYQELAWYDLYQEVERDPHVQAVMHSAKVEVANMPWDIDPYLEEGEKEAKTEDQTIARFVKRVIQQIEFFPQHLFNLMDALGMGFAVSEIMWNPTPEGVFVNTLLNRPQRRFQFDATTRTLKLRKIDNPYYGDPLPDKKFIVHRNSSQWENPFGDALDQSIYWMWLFKRTVLKFWMQHLQVGASSIPIVKHPPTANATLKGEALEIAQMIRNGAYGRMPTNFEIVWAEAANAMQNADTYERFVKTMDEQVSKCVQGETLTTDVGKTGTRAQGEVHQATLSSRTLYRAHALESTLNSTLIKWIVWFNFGEVPGMPRFRFDLEDPEDLKSEAVIVKTLSDAGFDFDEKELSGKFNYTIAKKEKPSGLFPPGKQKEEVSA